MPFPLAQEIYQVINANGEAIEEIPDLSPDKLIELYGWMVLSREFSERMVALQRQGRVGTFGPFNGQESSVALVAPLVQEDWFVGSYREIPAYFAKGMPLLSIMERYKGHITANYPPEVRCLPIQNVLATQMLHGVGLAMAIKYERKPNVTVVACGDGATSEGDFNEALNFAGVFKAPVVIVIQNNGWAISTPRHRQSATEYLAHRGPAFGMPGYVVDGNDVLAVYKIMADCVSRARNGEGPSLVELLTYRMGAHTTADDPRKYRPDEDLESWHPQDPLIRYQKYLMKAGHLTPAADEQIHQEAAEALQTAIDKLETLPPPQPEDIFDLVYAEPSPQLQNQRQLMVD